MKATKRPLPVTILAWVYIVTGVGGFAAHLIESLSGGGFHVDVIEAELVELLAVLSGAYMLRGKIWARWLALAWIGFHVILSAFHNVREFAIHALFFTVITWYLFRPDATRYFSGERAAD